MQRRAPQRNTGIKRNNVMVVWKDQSKLDAQNKPVDVAALNRSVMTELRSDAALVRTLGKLGIKI